MAQAFLITGTDTGIGKTTVASAIAVALHRRGRTVAVSKPVETGCDPGPDGTLVAKDAVQLSWAAQSGEPIERVCPNRLRDPLAPSVAARRAGLSLDLQTIAAMVSETIAGADVALVEGAGGLLVPLTDTASFADLARVCGLRVLVIVGNRLGAINHARLTLDCVRAAGLPLAGYIVNTLHRDEDLAQQTNAAVLGELCGPSLGVFPLVGCLGRSDADRRQLADAAEAALDLDALMSGG